MGALTLARNAPGLVVNPAARGSLEVLRLIEEEPRLKAVFREVLVLGRDGALGDLVGRLAARARRAGRSSDAIAVCGGDGTVQGVVNEVLTLYPAKRRPRLLLLPAGSHDNLARNLGLPVGDPGRRLRELAKRLDADAEMPAREVGTIRVNGIFGFVFCNGMAHRFLAEYFALGGRGAGDVVRLTGAWLGRIGAGLLSGQSAFPPYRAAVTVDGRAIAKRAFSFVLASTVPSMGFGFRACFRANGAPGAFHLVAPPASAAVLAVQIRHLFQGEPIPHADSFDALAREARIEMEEPAGYILDGELLGAAGTISIEAGPPVSIEIPD